MYYTSRVYKGTDVFASSGGLLYVSSYIVSLMVEVTVTDLYWQQMVSSCGQNMSDSVLSQAQTS
jgi:hypothetical protein